MLTRSIGWTKPFSGSEAGQVNNNIFNADFQDLIESFNKADVKYILVGGYSVILHGHSRTTGDMDLWVKPTIENFTRMVSAFARFGLPTDLISLDRFLDVENQDVFSFGRPPVAVDIMTQVKGLLFEDVFPNAVWFDINDDLKVKTISLKDLIKAKETAARHKDLDDLQNLRNE